MKAFLYMAEVLAETSCHLSKEQWRAGELYIPKEMEVQKESGDMERIWQDTQRRQSSSCPVMGHIISESAQLN